MSSVDHPSALSQLKAPLSSQPISREQILRLLNDAVWAPNDEHREPWRFICAEQQNALPELSSITEASLIVVAPLSPDPVKRIEDFAACCCLVENFRLLGLEIGWNVVRTLKPWTREESILRELGIGDKERIAAVLELSPFPEVAPQQSSEMKPIDFAVF